MRIAIIGWQDSGAGHVQEWFHSDKEKKVVCFISPDSSPLHAVKIPRSVSEFSYPENGLLKGLPLIVDPDWWKVISRFRVDAVIVVLEDAKQRLTAIENAKRHGIPILSAIHSSAVVCPGAKIGLGCVIFPNAVIGYRTEIDDGVLINTGSQIDHHCKLESGVTLAPGCVLAGNVWIGMRSYLFTSVTVINRIRIGKDSRIGAGSLVLRNIEENTLNYGVPARMIRYLEDY